MSKCLVTCLRCEFSFFGQKQLAICPACGAVHLRDNEGHWMVVDKDSAQQFTDSNVQGLMQAKSE